MRLIPELAGLPAPRQVLREPASPREGWRLPDGAGHRLIEQRASNALPAHTLMRRAGALTARLATACWPHVRHTIVLAGPGNNGGDGFEAAAVLRAGGRQVEVRWVLPAGADINTHAWPEDARQSLDRARAAGVPMAPFDPAETPYAPADGVLLIDALLGRGLSRAPQGRLAEAMAWVHDQRRRGTPVLAVDLPSGLPADRGAVEPGWPVVQADATLALLTLPVGLFTADGRDAGGALWFHDLGVPAGPDDGSAVWMATAEALAQPWPTRAHARHKGSFGDVVLVGGGRGMIGALRLAARAALVAGAGRVYMAPLDPDALTGGDPGAPELMTLAPEQLTGTGGLGTRLTIVAGCGGGPAIADRLPGLLADTDRLVLDADALNALAARPALKAALIDRGRRGLATILTPHPLEAARLLGTHTAAVQSDRPAAARALAEATGAVVVLKGSGTLVARPAGGNLPPCDTGCCAGLPQSAMDASCWLVPVGNAALGTPGSGDVLAGLIGSLWAQAAGLTPREVPASTLVAQWIAASAVMLHGHAAERARPHAAALPASDLVRALEGRQAGQLAVDQP